MKPQPSLATERILLRPMELSDASDIMRLAGDRDVASNALSIPHPYEEGMAEEWIRSQKEQYKEGQAVVFAVVLQASGELVGAVGLVLRPRDRNAELGYWIGKPYWNRGYATEAAARILSFGFEDLGLHRIHASVYPRNGASRAVLRKIGMTREGLRREHVKHWEAFEDLELYGILESEFRSVTKDIDEKMFGELEDTCTQSGEHVSTNEQNLRTIGLLGGMSWESTTEYYKIINRAVKEKLGGFHSARILLCSVDFAEMERRMRLGLWDEAGFHLAAEAKNLERAGAELMLLCTNTLHKVSDIIEGALSIPFIHIADATGEAIAANSLKKVGLLGTRYTMEEDFHRGRLGRRFDLEVIIPPEEDRQVVNDIIFNELCVGVIDGGSRERFKTIIEKLAAQGAEGMILGCTEIPLLIKPEDSPVPLFDTTELHALAAVRMALE